MNVVGLFRRVAMSRVSAYILHYSTKTRPQPRAVSAPFVNPISSHLFDQMIKVGNRPASMTAILDEWVERGNVVEHSFLNAIVKALKKYRRFAHALQVLEWISEDKNHVLSSSQMAIQLDLIAKVRGLEHAEKYFERIPEASRCYRVYGAFLNCYAYEGHLEKAEAILQKMRELGFATMILPYNTLLTAYSRAGKAAEMDLLLKELEDRDIKWDKYTYNIRMNAYVAASDFKAMEKLLMKMELDPNYTMSWQSYIVATAGFLNSGQTEKALFQLKRVERLSGNDHGAFQFLVTFYTRMGKKDEVFRLWNKYSCNRKFLNNNYYSMISSLIKLDDMAGAERIFEEWGKGRIYFDIRIPSLIIAAFGKRGQQEKAEGYINRLKVIDEEPKSSVWYTMAQGYYAGNEMEKAVEALEKAIKSRSKKWGPHPALLSSCLDYLREKGDVKAAEDILASLERRQTSAVSMVKDPCSSERSGVGPNTEI